MSGDVMFGRCECCGKEKPLQRTYFRYPINCQCHNNQHFELIDHCADCMPQKPKETKVCLSVQQIDEIAALREENDQQRHIIQQVVELRDVLVKTLPIIGELAESIGYGYYKPEDPRDFTPDFECCSKKEISNWKNDCVKADAGEEIGDMRAWGIGAYKIKDPEMIELREKIKTALTQPDPGAEIRERMKKLEAVAEALRNYRKFASVYCDQQENIAWQKVEKALADLGEGNTCT